MLHVLRLLQEKFWVCSLRDLADKLRELWFIIGLLQLTLNLFFLLSQKNIAATLSAPISPIHILSACSKLIIFVNSIRSSSRARSMLLGLTNIIILINCIARRLQISQWERHSLTCWSGRTTVLHQAVHRLSTWVSNHLLRMRLLLLDLLSAWVTLSFVSAWIKVSIRWSNLRWTCWLSEISLLEFLWDACDSLSCRELHLPITWSSYHVRASKASKNVRFSCLCYTLVLISSIFRLISVLARWLSKQISDS